MTDKQTNSPPLQIPVEIPPPEGVFVEPFSLKKVLRLMSYFGPAAVAASVSIGAGETLVVVTVGAWAKYSLLWLVLVAVLAKGVFVTYLLGRYTAITGQYFGQRMVRLPGPRGWLLMLLIVLELSVAGPVCAVIAGPCGELMEFVLRDFLPGGNPEFWTRALAITFVSVALLMSLKLNYTKLEKQNLIICGILVGGTILATLLVNPRFDQAALGTVTPDFPLTELKDAQGNPTPPRAAAHDFSYALLMITVFGYIGNTVFSYVVYANWVGIHRWGMTGHPDVVRIQQYAAQTGKLDYLPTDPDQAKRAQQRLAPLRWDVTMGALVLFIVTASFMMAGAQVLHDKVASGQIAFPEWKHMLTEQRLVWQNLSTLLVPVYYICVLAALWGTLNALPEIWTRVTMEFANAIWPSTGAWRYKTAEKVVVWFVLITCVACLALDLPLTLMAAFAATFTSSICVGIVAVTAVYLNLTLPRGYRPHTLVIIGGIAASAIMIIAAIGGVLGLAQTVWG